MADNRSQKQRAGRARHFTPRLDLTHTQGQGHIKTPSRSIILAARALAQELNIRIPREVVQKVSGVFFLDQAKILQQKQPRTRHNWPDASPDPRGRKRGLTRSNTRAIYDFVTDPLVSQSDRGAPWPNIAEAAGVQLPITEHFNPPGRREISEKAIRTACFWDEGIGNYLMEEEKELTNDQAQNRQLWIKEELPKKLRSRD